MFHRKAWCYTQGLKHFRAKELLAVKAILHEMAMYLHIIKMINCKMDHIMVM